ncbi:hypothetical protein [Faecalimonas sp.]
MGIVVPRLLIVSFGLEVNGLLSMVATDRYFKRTGFFYGIAVILLAFLYPVVIKVELEYWMVAIIILLQGLAEVIKYFFKENLTFY